MKRWLVILSLLLCGWVIPLHGQIRYLASEEAVATQSSANASPQSVRVENGKIWINGNLIAGNDLPSSLNGIDSEFKMQMTTYSGHDMRLYLFGKQYMVRSGRIFEIPSEYNSSGNVAEYDNQSKAEYFSAMKKEAPDQFYGIKKEAQLYERCMQLVLEYQMADASAQPKIKEEIRLLLGEQFDLNLKNMIKEVQQLEEELKSAKAIIETRRQNKTPIIDSRLKELTN